MISLSIRPVLIYFAILLYTFLAFAGESHSVYLESNGDYFTACEHATDSNTKCDASKGLFCRDGTCQCQFKDHQYYDFSKKACTTFVRGPCNLVDKKLTFACVENAKCVDDPQDAARQKCQCVPGFIESGNRTCEVPYGGKCGRGLMCDSLAPTFCIAGKCACRDDLEIYDETEHKCKGIVGAICDFMGHNCGGKSNCVATRNQDSLKGVCACPKETPKWNGKECAK